MPLLLMYKFYACLERENEFKCVRMNFEVCNIFYIVLEITKLKSTSTKKNNLKK